MARWPNHYDKCLAMSNNARRRAEAQPILRSKGTRLYVWDKSCGKCWYCGEQLVSLSNLVVDHLIPISSGGTDDLANLVPACVGCNRSKSISSLERFRHTMEIKAGYYFSPQQVEFLRGCGIEVPVKHYEFYFEIK